MRNRRKDNRRKIGGCSDSSRNMTRTGSSFPPAGPDTQVRILPVLRRHGDSADPVPCCHMPQSLPAVQRPFPVPGTGTPPGPPRNLGSSLRTLPHLSGSCHRRTTPPPRTAAAGGISPLITPPPCCPPRMRRPVPYRPMPPSGQNSHRSSVSMKSKELTVKAQTNYNLPCSQKR